MHLRIITVLFQELRIDRIQGSATSNAHLKMKNEIIHVMSLMRHASSCYGNMAKILVVSKSQEDLIL